LRISDCGLRINLIPQSEIRNPKSTMFFSFDGIDGVGKSTQVRLFCEALAVHGMEVVACRDPGSTALGDLIRGILLSHDPAIAIGRRSEMLLYMAARAQMVDEVIRPALAAGKVVVSDRYVLANVVYQAYAGGLDADLVREVGKVATDGIYPDCVFVLDMPPEAANERMNRELDRMEHQGGDFRCRLRDGYLAESARAGGRIHLINANQPIEAVQLEIWQIATSMLPDIA
jgi:dTMP kinase